MENGRFKGILGFVGRITVVHVVTYFVFGFFFAVVQNHEALYAAQPVPFMRPLMDILVVAGPLFQLIRGLVLALSIYPIRETLFNREKRGWSYLWMLFLGFAIIAPVGPSPGSIEGLVYTIVPLEISLSGWPEGILQTLAFSHLVYRWENDRGNRRIAIPLFLAFIISIAISALGVLFYL